VSLNPRNVCGMFAGARLIELSALSWAFFSSFDL
jgi:hypothetical protein